MLGGGSSSAVNGSETSMSIQTSGKSRLIAGRWRCTGSAGSKDWVLETAGRYWVAEKITSGTRSISNSLSIHGKGDLRHSELDRVPGSVTATANEQDFDFARLFTGGEEGVISPLSREGRVRQLCSHNEGKFTVATAKSILRDHLAGVCCHGDFETRGSQVSALSQGDHAHWFIKGPFPCQEKFQLSVFTHC